MFGKAELHYFLRDHDANMFEARQKTLRLIEKDLNENGGRNGQTDDHTAVQEHVHHHQRCMHLIENAKTACERANVPAQILPIRGGTDGCQLSFKGLPCPNLGTGGHAYHGPYEHITVKVWILQPM